MNKRKFNKKNILGIIKTYHAKRRQIERKVTDIKLKEVLLKGELIERDGHDAVIIYKGYHVHLSFDLEKIITVIAPDKQKKTPKTISANDGKKIKKIISQTNQKNDELIEEEMSFEDYMNNKFPKK